MPPEREYEAFLEEIRDFIGLRLGQLGNYCTCFWRNEFASPLIKKYIDTIVVKRSERSEWDANVTSGFLDKPVDTISKIVKRKSRKLTTYRRADEYWLVIDNSHRVSEKALPIAGIAEFRTSRNLETSLKQTGFSRVYAYTAMGWLQWDIIGDWQEVSRR
jgi:hypothetical protein